VSLSQLDLNLLVVLDAVLAERSVVRAARRMHVTPSAISNSMARLRAALGDPLFTRKGAGVVPTPRAAELAPKLARLLGELDRAVHPGAFDPRSTTREITLAVADAGQLSRLPRIVDLAATEMPHARLRVVGIDTFVSSTGLAGEIDAALIGIDDRSPGIHTTPLYAERAVLVARRGHPQVRGRMTKQRLAGLRHVEIQVAPGRGFRGLAAAYAHAGIAREIAVSVPTFIAAAAIVAASDLVATLPTSLVASLGDRMGLVAIEAAAPRVTTEIKLAWHERTHEDPALSAFRELVIVAAGDRRRGRS
jgi:DNA-binding transcriptional LysR family regulator